MELADLSLVVIAGAQALGILILLIVAGIVLPRIGGLTKNLDQTLAELGKSLKSVNELITDIKDRHVVEKALVALDSASGAVDKIDPLATDLQATMKNARELLDDATQTSQSLRARVDDLAAMQAELSGLAKSMTDLACDLRDHELARKLTNVMSDTSLLAADIGILTENANSYLESGKPLVSNIGGVVSDAKKRASGITSSLGNLREGIRAGAKTWKDEGQKK